jgi:hypothetical protein
VVLLQKVIRYPLEPFACGNRELHATPCMEAILEQRGSWPKQFYIGINVFMIKEVFTMSSLLYMELFLKN